MSQNIFSKAEQARLLAEHREHIAASTTLMRRAIDAEDLKEALKHAAAIVGELRTGYLTPRVYYELYLEVFDRLSQLELFFAALARKGAVSMAELYRLVQHAGNVLVRLYLVITAGSVVIKSGAAPSAAILRDLLEIVKGVQHPQRGLFLRYYLFQKCKDKVPDAGTPYEGPGGTIGDALTFIIANMGEMNRLWARMATSPAAGGPVVRNRKRREKERLELRTLMGAGMTRLSGLNGMSLPLFTTDVLPRVLNEIITSGDRLAQQYLMDALLQVFPVEYLVSNLSVLLGALKSFIPDHSLLKTVFTSIVARIQGASEGAGADDKAATEGGVGGSTAARARFTVATASGPPPLPRGLPSDVDIFNILLGGLEALATDPAGPFRPTTTASAALGAAAPPGEAPAGAAATPPAPVSEGLAALRAATSAAFGESLASLLALYNAMASFATTVYPGYAPFCDAVLRSCAATLREALGMPAAGSAAAAAAAAPPALLNEACGSQVLTLVGCVQTSLGLDVLALDHVAPLLPFLRAPLRRALSQALVDAVLGAASRAAAAGVPVPRIASLDVATRLCAALKPIMQDVATPLRGAGGSSGALAALGSGASSEEVPSGAAPASGSDGASGAAPTVPATPATTQLLDFDAEQANLARLILLFGGTTDGGVAGAIAGVATAAAKQAGEDSASSSASSEPAGGEAAAASSSRAPPPYPLTPESDTDTHFAVLGLLREALSFGGKKRLLVSLPALLTNYLELARRMRARELAGCPGRAGCKRVFQVTHEVCSALGPLDTEAALQQFLLAAAAADPVGYGYEFYAAAFLLYEDLVDSGAQARALKSLIGAMAESRFLELEAYESLIARCTQHSVRLLRKEDQVRSVLACARLFWRAPVASAEGEAAAVASRGGLASPLAAGYERPKEVLQCLNRVRRVASEAMPLQPGLFVEILDAAVHFFERGCTSVTPAALSELLAQTQGYAADAPKPIAAHLANVVAHMRDVKASAGGTIYAAVTGL